MNITGFINRIDIIKSKGTIASIHEASESTGIEGVNDPKKITMADGKSYLVKLKSREHNSWRNQPPNSQYLRERAAYLISEQLGFNLVPKVELTRFGDDIGSKQDWVQGKHVFSDYLGFIKGLSDEQLMQCGALDLILGSSDRHGQNFLCQLVEM